MMGNTMKAIVLRGPMQFEMEDVPMPECPEGGFVLKVIACGLCGSDLRTLRSGHSKVKYPWIIGHEIAGTVVEDSRRIVFLEAVSRLWNAVGVQCDSQSFT